jgi:hypothetical protein
MEPSHRDQERQDSLATDSADLRRVVVRPIRAEDEARWKELMACHHYLGFRVLVGNSLKYVATLGTEWVGLLGWGSAAFKIGARDRWIGWSAEQQFQRLHLVANNQRFLILPGVRIRNLASRILGLSLQRLGQDWQAVYGHPVLLAETFVDPSRFVGTCYRAAGWLPLGQTRGYGRNAGRYYPNGVPKLIFVRPLCQQSSRLLSAPFLAPGLSREGGAVIDLNTVSLQGAGGLLEELKKLQDPRRRRGIRHSQISILAMAICACLSGAKSFVAIGEWGMKLTQDLLERMGCRKSPSTGLRSAPSERTVRRTLQSIDADEVDALVGDWFYEKCPDAEAVAFDGKTLRGSTGSTGKPVHLIAALLHKEKVVVAQRAVAEKTNEITGFKPTLKPLDLEGKVITADAMHAQVGHAKFLKEEKKADYVFTVKDNQPTLRQNIEDLEPQDFSPSGHRD